MRALILAAVLVAAMTGSAWAEQRLALIVANSNYDAKIGKLANPTNDARLIRDSLVSVGFDVTLVEDLDQRQLRRALRDHRDKIEVAGKDAVSFFYYSGHGAADSESSANYLVPLDADIGRPRDLPIEALPVSEIVRSFAASKQNFVVIDACRNFPFEFADSRSISKGFIPERERRGTLIAFATSPGTVASDEGVGGGPYARALSTLIKTPGSDHIDVFKGVQDVVDTETSGEQFPWYRDGVPGRFKFSARPVRAQTTARVATSTVGTVVSPATPFVDARTALPSTKAPVVTTDHAALPDFALFKDCEDCPDMVVLPGGNFRMESLADADCCQDATGPKIDATVGRFAIARFETTYAEWHDCTAAGKCPAADDMYRQPEWTARPFQMRYNDDPAKNLSFINENRRSPAVDAYLSHIANKSGSYYRLPSEAEWVYASLGGKSTKFYWGDQEPVRAFTALNGANVAFDTKTPSRANGSAGYVDTVAPGSYRPNPFGLFDMIGNAWEVVDACLETDPYTRIARQCGGLGMRGGDAFDGPWQKSVNTSPIRHDDWTSRGGIRLARSL